MDVSEKGMLFETIVGKGRRRDKGVLEAEVIERLGNVFLIGMTESCKYLGGCSIKEDSSVGVSGEVCLG